MSVLVLARGYHCQLGVAGIRDGVRCAIDETTAADLLTDEATAVVLQGNEQRLALGRHQLVAVPMDDGSYRLHPSVRERCRETLHQGIAGVDLGTVKHGPVTDGRVDGLLLLVRAALAEHARDARHVHVQRRGPCDDLVAHAPTTHDVVPRTYESLAFDTPDDTEGVHVVAALQYGHHELFPQRTFDVDSAQGG